MTAETVVLERESLPEVARKPPPWVLHGSAYVMIVRLPEDTSDAQLFVSPSLANKRHGQTVFAMFMDYETSNCGPYRELLFAPASFNFDEGRYPSITRIYVSTYDSVVNGRNNWGIPKDQADFTVEVKSRAHRVTVRRQGRTVAQLHLSHHGLGLPVTSALLPSGMRTVLQPWQGQLYGITLKAKGSLRLAKVVEWSFDPTLFPDLARGSVVAAGYLPRFEMTFPVPTQRPLTAG
jgi:hypothetical protein